MKLQLQRENLHYIFFLIPDKIKGLSKDDLRNNEFLTLIKPENYGTLIKIRVQIKAKLGFERCCNVSFLNEVLENLYHQERDALLLDQRSALVEDILPSRML